MPTSNWRHYFDLAQRILEGVHAAWLAKDWAELAICGVSCLHALTESLVLFDGGSLIDPGWDKARQSRKLMQKYPVPATSILLGKL